MMLNAKSVGFYFLFRIIQNNHFLHNYSKIEKIFVLGGICGDASNFDTISKNYPEIFMDKSFVVVVQGGLAASCRLWQIFFLYYLLSTRRNTKNKSFYLPWMCGMLIACETARFDLDVMRKGTCEQRETRKIK